MLITQLGQGWIQDYLRGGGGANQSGSRGGAWYIPPIVELHYQCETSKGNGICASYYEQLCGVNRIQASTKK